MVLQISANLLVLTSNQPFRLLALVDEQWIRLGGFGRLEAMFEELEHKKTPEEKRFLVLEIIGAVIACTVLGVVVVWFFSYFGEY